MPDIEHSTRVPALCHKQLCRVIPSRVLAVDNSPDDDPIGRGGRREGRFEVVDDAANKGVVVGGVGIGREVPGYINAG